MNDFTPIKITFPSSYKVKEYLITPFFNIKEIKELGYNRSGIIFFDIRLVERVGYPLSKEWHINFFYTELTKEDINNQRQNYINSKLFNEKVKSILNE